MAYLTLFCRKFPKNSRKKSQRSGRGGGQAGWAKIPTFTENLFCKLPLFLHHCIFCFFTRPNATDIFEFGLKRYQSNSCQLIYTTPKTQSYNFNHKQQRNITQMIVSWSGSQTHLLLEVLVTMFMAVGKAFHFHVAEKSPMFQKLVYNFDLWLEMQNDVNRCNADVTFCRLMPSTSFQPTFSTRQGFLR